jgi:rubrerythrin
VACAHDVPHVNGNTDQIRALGCNQIDEGRVTLYPMPRFAVGCRSAEGLLEPTHGGLRRMFTFSDIRNIAIQIEQNGEAVYRRAASTAGNPQIAHWLEIMAEQEAEHARWFEQLEVRRSLEPKDRRVHEFGYELLRSMMVQQTFSLDDQRLSAAAKIEDILNQSIEFENDTILFYELLYTFLDNSETMGKLEEIIDEERSHINRLNEIAKMIQSS